jgi:hypothetical protein
LFDFDSADHCYVKRQPTSDTEMEKAFECSELRNSTVFDIAGRIKPSFDR